MFTGIIEAVCRVQAVSAAKGGLKLAVEIGKIAPEVKIGDSIAVNGVCLTASAIKQNIVEFDVSGESLSKTTLEKLKTGSHVNIERAMRADARFGGHFVQGHIDVIGKITKIQKEGDFWRFNFSVSDEIKGGLVAKGSIAIDGVSLTLAGIDKNNFSVAIIPATFENTIFKNYKVGDSVNIETDILCRIIQRQLENMLPNKTMTIDKLKEMGF
ncbi:MAG: riboflavin synthase [Phycisphaerae bacterium]